MRFPDNCVSHTAHIVMAMPTFSREEIVHLGDLARIALTDEEITRLQGELNVIADSINKVQEVASDDVPPTANPVPLEAYLRPDVAETPLTQEEALAGGPKTEAGMFVAPRILGSELVATPMCLRDAGRARASECANNESTRHKWPAHQLWQFRGMRARVLRWENSRVY